MPSNTSKKNRLFSVILAYSAIFILLLFLFFFAIFQISGFRHLTFIDVLSQLTPLFYVPHQNIFKVHTVNGINFLQLLYYVAAVAFILLYAVKFIVRRAGRRSFLDHVSIPSIGLSLAVFLLLLQIPGQTIFFFKNFVQFSSKTTEQKISFLYSKIPDYSKYCKKHLPGRHLCEPVTDLDRNNPDDMFTYSAFQYHLYPISILNIPGQPTDCKVIFVKKNAIRYAGEDFEAKEPFTTKNLIAIRKKP